MVHRRRAAAGFTVVELIITVAIVGILASIATAQMRDYVRRASLSEVVLSISKCKNTISENFMTLDSAPAAGRWGCEQTGAETKFTGTIQTSANGVVRVSIQNLDRVVNGQYIYLIPAKSDGNAMIPPADLGKGVTNWVCGSDWLLVRKALPSNCRSDTTVFALQDFN